MCVVCKREEVDIDLIYIEMMSTENCFENFNTMKEFVSELEKGRVVELERLLIEYQEVEMYEFCSEINKVLISKRKK